jgi:hypothetical protein
MADPSTACDGAREALWPDPMEPASAEARAHYDRCSDCQAFFARDRRLAARLAGLPRPPAPTDLRECVARGLASRPRWSIASRRAAVGVVAIAAALMLAVLARPDPMDDVVRPFAAEARASASGDLAMTSSDAVALGGWFATTLGSPVTIPSITGADLMGGKVALIGGRRVAVIVYHLHGDPLTYFASSDHEMGGRGMPDDEIRMGTDDGVEVAVWREPRGVRAVAAAMPRADVMAVATECRTKARMTGP